MSDLNFDAPALYRNVMLVLLLLAIALIVHNVFSQNGYLASRRQRKELHTLQQQIQQLKDENQELDKENHALKSDPAAIERMAREQMGLAKPGEKIYTVPDKTHPRSPETKEEAPRPYPRLFISFGVFVSAAALSSPKGPT